MSSNLSKTNLQKMHRSWPGFFIGLAVMMLGLLNGCTSTPPIQEMSDARQSVEAAKQAGATELAPGAIDSAEQLLNKAKVGMRSGNFEEAQQDAIAAREAARQALAISEVKQIQETNPPPKAEAAAEVISPSPTYQISKGDTLWSIAAKSEVYGDPLLWPLLLKENRQQIPDADLIFPGQVIQIDMVASDKEMQSARQHALARGNWHLGNIERSDLRYLSE